jgi:thiol-disulfide isomerase/thioredoxin
MKLIKQLLLPLIIVLLCVSPLNEAASSINGKYYALSPQEIVDYAKRMDGRKAIFIYASWCPHCRRAIPGLAQLEKQYPGSILTVSVDTDTKAWASYIRKQRDFPFYPVVLKSPDPYGLEKSLSVPYRRGVPHYILLDEKNRVVKSANMHTRNVEKFLKKK